MANEGKTFLAEAVATETKSTFFSVSSADLVSKWQGESPRLVKILFKMARESPDGRAVIFIDELDYLGGSRSKEGNNSSPLDVMSELLRQMQGLGTKGSNVLVLAATNLPWNLDAALRQRFEKRVYIPLPDAKARSEMVKMGLRSTPNNLSEDNFTTLGQKTEGSSGRDIKILVKEALNEPINQCMRSKHFKFDGNFCVPCKRCPYCPPELLLSDTPGANNVCEKCGAKRMQPGDFPWEQLKAHDVEMKDFEKFLRQSHKSVSDDEMKNYTKWTKEFGTDGL